MLKEEILKLVEEKVAGTDCFLVDVKVSPSKIMVYLDTPAGIKIEDCIAVNRFLREKYQDSDVLEHHELEVSSPGMDQPLKVLQQYQKRAGKEISVITFDGLKHEGLLESVTNEEIVLKMTKREKGKKEKAIQQIRLPFSQIKETKIIFSLKSLK